MDSNRNRNGVYRRVVVAAALSAATMACAAAIADAAPEKDHYDVRSTSGVTVDSVQISPQLVAAGSPSTPAANAPAAAPQPPAPAVPAAPQATATCSPLPTIPLRVREGTTTDVAGNWDCLDSVSSDDESRAKASLVTSNSHKTLQVTGISGGKSPAIITLTGGVNGTVEVHVRPKQAAQTAIVTAFGFSNIPVLTFNNPPANVNATPAPGTVSTTAPTTFRSLINENSGQRTGFGITALARITDGDYVNGYAMVGAFAGSNGGYIVGGGVGYKETVYLVAGAHFVNTQRLNGYTLDQAVPAGMTSIPTITRQTSGLFIGLGINIGNLTDVLSGKAAAK